MVMKKRVFAVMAAVLEGRMKEKQAGRKKSLWALV